MRRSTPAVLFYLSLAVFWMVVTGPAKSAEAVTILEYLVPTAESSPAGLAVDAEGHIWFTEMNGDKIGRLDPAEAKPGTAKGIIEYDLPRPYSEPNDIMVARSGMIWFSEMGGNRIGRLDPATGKITEYSIPTAKSEPHNLVEAADGAIWFVEFEANKIARLDPKDGAIQEFAVNAGHPHDLVIQGNRIWFSQGGKFWAQIFFNKMVSFDMKTHALKEIVIPPENSVPHGVTLDAAGRVWFTQFFAQKISRMEPAGAASPKIVDYLIPGKGKGPHDIAVDDKNGRVWFVLNHAGSVGRLDLSRARPGTSEGMDEFKIPTPGSHPNALALDSQGHVWFTEMGEYFRGKYQNKIGRLIP